MRTFAVWVCMLTLALLLYVTLRPRWEYRVETWNELAWKMPATGLGEKMAPADAGREGWELVSARWLDAVSGYECILRRRVFP